jgi:hypothetical protein
MVHAPERGVVLQSFIYADAATKAVASFQLLSQASQGDDVSFSLVVLSEGASRAAGSLASCCNLRRRTRFHQGPSSWEFDLSGNSGHPRLDERFKLGRYSIILWETTDTNLAPVISL